ncbi:polysaccharide deacetylase family protein [Shivajiella indica]|uniref:Polysaccharide deacetylase family protein n=1 Tax=Shivajiella indica TaxID=872115 RepID=A0ABW5BGD0_9BACT
MVLIHHIPPLITKIFPQMVWHKDRGESKVYLTFDDGPVPDVTDFVLDELGKRGLKATFFMVGDNVRKNPTLAMKVMDRGHKIGNHTFHHIDGYKTKTEDYLKEVESCHHMIEQVTGIKTKLFRPPYGKITRDQFGKLKSDHEVIMWDVLSGDYDPQQSPELCLSKSKQYTQNGSIILFHDQEKTHKVLRAVLPSFLEFLVKEGFETHLL